MRAGIDKNGKGDMPRAGQRENGVIEGEKKRKVGGCDFVGRDI